jgi:hypothetical protein
MTTRNSTKDDYRLIQLEAENERLRRALQEVITTESSRLEGRPALWDQRASFRKDAGLGNTPTEFTYWLRMGVSGYGSRAMDWSDKPHRLVYDACREIERISEVVDAALHPNVSKND